MFMILVDLAIESAMDIANKPKPSAAAHQPKSRKQGLPQREEEVHDGQRGQGESRERLQGQGAGTAEEASPSAKKKSRMKVEETEFAMDIARKPKPQDLGY